MPELSAPATADDVEERNLDRLRQHFAQRVSHQSHMVLEAWIRLNRGEWSTEGLTDLELGCERLARYAQRFDQGEHLELAEQLQNTFSQVRDNRNRPSSGQIQQLTHLMQNLSKTGLRLLDDQSALLRPQARKPVYVCLSDSDKAERIVQQLLFFWLARAAFG